VVQETGLPFALLGMTFLNRTEMRREGDMMVLAKRF
jgi:aspartyl protease family protein